MTERTNDLPSSDLQDAFSHDPDFIENEYRLPRLAHLLQSPNVVGVARLLTLPAFTSERILTLVYTDTAVSVTSVIGNTSLYHSLGKDTRAARKSHETEPRDNSFDQSVADIRSSTLSLRTGRVPLLISTWGSLKAEALRAPSCRTDFCCDGVSYWHRILDNQAQYDTKWSNPRPIDHERQCQLVACYSAIISLANLFPERRLEAIRRSKKNRAEREAWRRKQNKRKQSRK